MMKKKPFKNATTSVEFWFCPMRQQQVHAGVCGKAQTTKRRRCASVNSGDVCEHLDSTLATSAWAEYQERSQA